MRNTSSLFSYGLLGAIIFFCSAASGWLLYLYDNTSLIYFGDAVSHIVRARQFIDSQQPGLDNIGTVWLPLPHLLLLPFVAFDTLFYHGIAGAIIGIPFLVGTTLLLFSILVSLTHSRPLAFFFALLFGLNPNVIYIALTPMNEISLLFFVTLAGYFLLRWIRTEEKRWMIFCSLTVLCATLCRYEAWILAPFISLVALVRAKHYWNSRHRGGVIQMIGIASLCWFGIIFWFAWNYFQYGDMLKFAHWTYSVGTSSVRATLRDRPLDVFTVLGKALLWIFGPMLIGISALTLFPIKKIFSMKEQSYLLIFFSLPAVFVLSAILIGFIQIDRWWWNWRFVLTFGLFLSTAGAIMTGTLFEKLKSPPVRLLMICCFSAMPIAQLTIPAIGVAVFNDAAKSFDARSRSAAALGKEIQTRYEGGSIALLTGYGVGQRMMISSQLPIKTFNVLYFSNDSIPAIFDRYIILGKDQTPESEEFSRYWKIHRDSLLRLNTISIESSHFVLLEHNDWF